VTPPAARNGRPLDRLAAARGVATRYLDAFDREVEVSDDALVAVLQALGESLESPDGAERCLKRLQSERASARPDPVLVAWDGELPARPDAAVRLELEDGTDATQLLASGAALPHGYHRLVGPAGDTLVVSAPRRPPPLDEASFGIFAPTYALFDGRDTPAGDLTALAELGRLAGRLGAGYLATLPLLADYSDKETPSALPSPYSPLTRFFWNEAYLDLGRLPELAGEVRAGRVAGPPPRLADVAAAASFARPLLGLAADRLVARGGPRLESYKAFQASRPDVLSYATYRAAAEVAGADRSRWPREWDAGTIHVGRDVPEEAVRAHVYAQWATDAQLAEVAAGIAAGGCRLMLDLPIGSRADGYDPWAYPASYVGTGVVSDRGASVGAPPDQFFARGQDWGFRPLHPCGERAAGYPVVRQALRHLLSHCGALRIDHVMGLQRLWWIPDGASPGDGAYVHYRTDELLAVAILEATRHGASLVGEDLGTVDPGLRSSLDDHGVAGMHVAVFDLEARPGKPLSPRAGSVAFVDTHDTATFAGWFDGSDVEDRLELGIVDEKGAEAERAAREEAREALVERLVAAGAIDDPLETATTVHSAVLEELGGSDAALVMVTLEDLWGEHDPQNVPGTSRERLNFCRRLAVGIDELEQATALLAPLARLRTARLAARRQGR
jgi:4-alpha-glucanotransferase